MVASHGQGEIESEYGVIQGHAYSVISVKILEINAEEGEVVRLVQMRNPWGHGEWQGDWSDESPLWTDELKEQIGLEVKDDGIFYISIEDYLSHFKSTSFCVENDLTKYVHNYAKSNLGGNRKRAYLTFELPEDIDCAESALAVSCY